MTLAKGDSPQEAADEFLSKSGATVRRRYVASVHGLSAFVVESSLKDQDTDLGFLSYFIQKDGSVYVFHGFAAVGDYDRYSDTFVRVMQGFDTVRDRAVLDKKPRRVSIESVPSTGRLSDALRALGAEEEMLSDLAILNGKRLDEQVRKAQFVKVVRE